MEYFKCILHSWDCVLRSSSMFDNDPLCRKLSYFVNEWIL